MAGERTWLLLPLEAADGDYTVSYWFVTDDALNDNRITGDELDGLGFSKVLTF